jgi:YVTN family beta-propeller protein
MTAYVTNEDSGTVTPIAVATNTPGRPIPVGTYPAGIAITPDESTAYVTNQASGTVTPIAVGTNTPGSPIPVGSGPFGIAITTPPLTQLPIGTGTPPPTQCATPARCRC